MGQIKLNEAIEKAKRKGSKKIQKKVLAEKLWPGRKASTQQVNMTNLCNGTTKSVTQNMVAEICDYLAETPSEKVEVLKTIFDINN